MPAPTTSDEFLELIRKSGVVDEKRLNAHIERLRGQGQIPVEPVRLATQLVRDGVLTHFQAEQFLQGKWRRFTIGKYKVLERLGAGGMGSVYLCEHTLMRRRVAVKVLPAGKTGDTSSLERFYREARAVAALDHPNIVRAYDIDQDDNLHFLVMEHVDGSSLQEMIKKAGPMDPIRSAHYIRQAALGLQHAHETAGLVHRDIKPGNVLVDRNGIVKVLDMGLARFFNDEEDLLTKKYDENVLGTADYLAPEQALDSHSVDIRADIYSLGGTFYFCLTGRTPFAEGSVAQKLIWHQTRQPKPVTVIRSDVPEGILAVLEKMMAKDRDTRFQTPQEVADALDPWTRTPIPPPPENEMPYLSLAASRGPNTESSMSSTKSTADAPPLMPTQPRKQWQVNAGATPSQATSSTATTSGGAASTKATLPPMPNRPAPEPAIPDLTLSTPQLQTQTAPPIRPQPMPSSVQPNQAAGRPAPVPNPRSGGLATIKSSETETAVVASDPMEMSPVEQVAPTETGDDDLSIAVETPRPKKRGTPPVKKGIPRWVIIVIGLGVGLASAFGIWMLMNPTPVKPDKGPTREPIKVPGGVPNALFSALRRAKDGDKLILQGDIVECNLTIDKKDLTIEAEPGVKVTWKSPPKVDQTSKLFIVQGVANFVLRGITLDGDNQTESLVTLYGKCPGTKLEKLEMKNTKKYGVLLANCEGTSDNTVQLLDLTIHTQAGQSAIRFDIYNHSRETVPQNRYFTIRDCKFPGQGHKISTADLSFVDATTLELPTGVTLVKQP